MQIIVCQSRQELSTQWTLWSLATTGLSIVFTKPGGAGFLPPENLQVDECSQGATLLSKPILYGITDGVFVKNASSQTTKDMEILVSI